MKKETQYFSGVRLAQRLLASQRETQRIALAEFKTNPDVQRVVQELIQRNEQRGTPVITDTPE